MTCSDSCTCKGSSGRIGFADRATQASPRARSGLGHSVSVPLRELAAAAVLCLFLFILPALFGGL